MKPEVKPAVKPKVKTNVKTSISNIKDDKLDKLYKEIHKYYKTINREMVNRIVIRTDDIADMYYKYTQPDMNDKERKHIENTLLTKRILNNDKCNEASTFNTVLTFICGVFHFMWAYENEPNKLFNHTNIWDYLHCAVHEFNMNKRHMFIFNDDNIPETVKQFLDISDNEIQRLLKLNFK